jgi:hypothetical protein
MPERGRINMILTNLSRMSTGNRKLRGIHTFDLPAGASCLNSKDCFSTCYAMKAERLYPTARRFREQNFQMAKEEPGLLSRLLTLQIETSPIKIIRIHSSGDFFSQGYIDLWERIVGSFPDRVFYAYTKVGQLFDFGAIERHENFNLIPSYIEGHINFGPLEYVKDLKKRYGAHICPATIGEEVRCNDGCSWCLTHKKVVFKIH